MKRVCEVLVLLVLFAPPVRAGVNAGGVLVAHDAALVFTESVVCGQGSVPASCAAIDTRIDGAYGPATAAVWKVYAAFPQGSSPRLSGISWGIQFSLDLLGIISEGSCGDFEIHDEGWPGNDLGSAQTWNSPQTAILTQVYWFAGYSYGLPTTFALRDHPTSGGWFYDDTPPGIQDPISGYGTIGFDQPGTLICRSAGACCDSMGVCAVVDSTLCVSSRREYRGTGSACSPNPCPQPGTCCIGSGDCVFVAEPWCTPIPGMFLPGGSGDCGDCRPTESGYCCLSTTCLPADWITCALQEGLYHGSSWPEPCLPNPCYWTGVGDERHNLPVVSLGPPVPNPSYGAIQYSITLPQPGQVRVLLLDVAGRLVLDLPERQLSAGAHTLSWDLVAQNGLRLPSGLYTLRLDVTSAAPASARGSADDQGDARWHETRTRRVILLR